MQTWWSLVWAGKLATPCSVHFDNFGVTMVQSSTTVQLGWQQISAVFAYKRDCVFLDQICVVLVDESRQISIQVAEEDDVYRELISELPSRLHGCLPLEVWWPRVVLPAFETKWTRLYSNAV